MAAAEIPKRTSFRPAEVCTIAGVPPYVLRSWETEFPALCSTKNAKGTRVYGRSDVELVVQIKELVFGEGLTLGAARKKLEGERNENLPPPELPIEDVLGADARQKLVAVKQGLQAVLDMLSGNGAGEPVAAPVEPAPVEAVAAAASAGPAKAVAAGKKPRAKSARGRAAAAKTTAAKTTSKRKRRTA